MESPLAPVLANVYIEHFEQEVLMGAPQKPHTGTDTSMTHLLCGPIAWRNQEGSRNMSTISIWTSGLDGNTLPLVDILFESKTL
jgi:hypothetical protein